MLIIFIVVNDLKCCPQLWHCFCRHTCQVAGSAVLDSEAEVSLQAVSHMLVLQLLFLYNKWFHVNTWVGWHLCGLVDSGVMVKALACDLRGRKLNSQPLRCQVTILGKLFTHICFGPQTVYNLVPITEQRCDWEGNHRSGSYWQCVTDLSGLSTYRLKA